MGRALPVLLAWALSAGACGDDDGGGAGADGGGGADGGDAVTAGCPAVGRPADRTPCTPVGISCHYDPDTGALLPDADPCALRTDCVSSDPDAEIGEFVHWDGVACGDAGIGADGG